MFSRLATQFSKPAVKSAAGLSTGFRAQTRFLSKQATGSKGRKMPFNQTRATAPVANLDATFTIRVRNLRRSTETSL